MNSAELVFLVLYLLFINLVSQGQLEIGFYSQTCPNAESIVKSVVREATLADPRIPPVLLRLHFHDCFVEGCDGSILIENGAIAEKKAVGHQGVGGFEQIMKAKQEIEAQCPGVVSCADIVAMAARDAVALAGGPIYAVETGRRDGRVSNVELASDMPEVNDSIETLKSKFRNKGLSNQELVLLSGAHTIGTTACFFMPKRLYDFNETNAWDPQISPSFLPKLRGMCPQHGDVNARIPMDPLTKDKFDDQIMRNIKKGFAVLASDARLYDDGFTRQVVDFYAGGSKFAPDFATAMLRMGRIGVKLGSNGEIRRTCHAFN
ncbi:peroxidase 43-like [Salvia miltiorrhiza]|uniref:peroxidase 43-like n=1 Tax=Salvia miltiorrhiza TaxID=226208 RepID=UPI0025ABC8EC|nr:peroxidase 43-like [Salvia miltiorrhiza]